MSTDQLQELKLLIKGVVMSCPEEITISQLQKDFKSMEGYNIPYRKVGYPSLDAFLQSIDDTIYVVGSGPCAKVGVVKNKKSEHIVNMVQQQKRSKTGQNSRKARRALPPLNPTVQAKNIAASNFISRKCLSKNAGNAEDIQRIINNTRATHNTQIPTLRINHTNSRNAQAQATSPAFYPFAPPLCSSLSNLPSTIISNNYSIDRNVYIPFQPYGSIYHPHVVLSNLNNFTKGPSSEYQSALRPQISVQSRLYSNMKTHIASHIQHGGCNFGNVGPILSPDKQHPSTFKMSNNLKVGTNLLSSELNLKNEQKLPHRKADDNFPNHNTKHNQNKNVFGNTQAKINSGENLTNSNQNEKLYVEHLQHEMERKNPVESNYVDGDKAAPVTDITVKPYCECSKTLPDLGYSREENNLSSSFKSLQIHQNDLSILTTAADENAFSISSKTRNVAESPSESSSDYSCKANKQICGITDDMHTSNSKTDATETEQAVPMYAVNELIYHLDFPHKTVPFGVKIPEAKLPSDVTLGNIMGIFISEIHSPFHFWFHVHSKNMELDEIMERLDNYYTFFDEDYYCVPPICAIPGQVCATLFSNSWHRAEILSTVKDNKVKVLFVDYGTISEVNVRNVKYLHTTFAELPAQAHRGCLSHLKPSNLHWSSEATMRFIAMAFDLMLWARVTDIDETSRISYLILCDTNGTEVVQINQKLVEWGYAFYDDEWNKDFRKDKPRKRHPREEIPTFEMIESGAYPTLWDMSLLQSKGIMCEDIIDAVIFKNDKQNLKKHVLNVIHQLVQDPLSFVFKADKSEAATLTTVP